MTPLKQHLNFRDMAHAVIKLNHDTSLGPIVPVHDKVDTLNTATLVLTFISVQVHIA